ATLNPKSSGAPLNRNGAEFRPTCPSSRKQGQLGFGDDRSSAVAGMRSAECHAPISLEVGDYFGPSVASDILSPVEFTSESLTVEALADFAPIKIDRMAQLR